ncbi:hypothetical protein HRI_001513500 [Hibiscus trionum]|uniref:Uncharacterized protein n=1 Tax=Hibiscus trionum TaxID=183268 RepID=A0A9W7HJB1_HIBTR|nr:hypothetical protein HRI_001513500 [Hibiscus trionum]
MENFRIGSSNSKKDVAGGGRRRSKPNDQAACCRKHPKHKQSPGVCSLCLRDKLSRLPANSSSRCTTTIGSSCSSSLSSYCSSSSASSSYASSPMHRYSFPKEGKDGFSLLFISGKNMLTKSKSVAFASRLRSKQGMNKTGFLSKFLHPRRVR